MATNDDLDDFFKKKDRKGNKTKKQTGILTNNEELLKQLLIVTSATTAFKENMDFDDDDDEQQQQQPPINDSAAVGTGLPQETHKHHKTKVIDDIKTSNGQATNTMSEEGHTGQQQDEWEEVDSSNSKYEQIRSKFAGRPTNDDDDDEFYDDDNHPNRNDDNHEGQIDREQAKDKPVWNFHQVNQPPAESVAPIVEEPIVKPAPVSTGAYRPPQLRTGGGSVTIVSGNSQRPAKKKEPNFASTDEFPTLKSTVNKK